MRKFFKVFLALALGFSLSGCAGIIEIRVPPEFRGKKQIEDPPLQ